MIPKKPKCPVCGKLQTPEDKPFCSKRCADIDLGRWLKEGYRVPSEESPDDEDGEARDENKGTS
jgi:uncharacterized protein